MKASDVTPPKHASSGVPANLLTLNLDMEKYLGQLGDWDITEQQKRDFIETLWNLLRTFAEIGFDIHPVQQAQKACGQLAKTRSDPAITGSGALYLEGLQQTKLNKDFGASGASGKEEIQP